MEHGLKALVALLILAASAQEAIGAIVTVKATVPLKESQISDCSAYGPGSQCWSSGVQLVDPVVFNIATDTLRMVLDFPGPFRLRWEDSGNLIFTEQISELARADDWDQAVLNNRIISGNFDQSRAFANPIGDVISPMTWNRSYGTNGGLAAFTYAWPEYITNFADSSFSFTGATFEIALNSCTAYETYMGYCTGLVSIDRVQFWFGNGLFSILRPAPEPGTLALLGLAGLGLSRRRRTN